MRRMVLWDDDAFGHLIVFAVVLIIVFALLFAGSYILGDIGTSMENYQTETENFTVDDPSVDKDCNLGHDVTYVDSVRYHNGTAWNTLSSGDYTVVGNVVTVNAAAMV